MNNAVQEGISANTAVGYRAGVPVVTFEQPGSRMVTMQQAAVPSAPVQLQPPNQNPGLWEQCCQLERRMNLNNQMERLEMDFKLDMDQTSLNLE